MVDNKYLHSEITNLILQGFVKVYNTLGKHMSLEIYKNALRVEFERLGLNCEQNGVVRIIYENVEVGEIAVDLIVNQKVIVKIFILDKISFSEEIYVSQYLRNSKIEVGMILSFGTEPIYKRKIFTNDLKAKKPNVIEV
ncbi:MAG: GxxExxY protein [bacterium]|nr:GxxExxY protein [bacterium]